MKTGSAAINRFHQHLLATTANIGHAHHYVCGWSSSQSQEARFLALIRAVNFRVGSVVDYGCGTGDLYRHLQEADYKASYLGVDMNADMIAVAKGSYSADFKQIAPDKTDFDDADFIFASGIFQFQDRSNPQYYMNLTQALFDKCKVGLAINFLSALRDDKQKDPNELYIYPSEAIEIASALSHRWTLDHSYHPGSGDMTIGILKVADNEHWKRPAL